MISTSGESINEYERVFGLPEKRPTLFPEDDESYLRLRDFIISSDVEEYDHSKLPFSSITDAFEYEASLTRKYKELRLRIKKVEEEKFQLEIKRQEFLKKSAKGVIIGVIKLPIIRLASSLDYSKYLLLGILKTLGDRPE